MKCLVIGGTGLQGAPTVRHLLAAGHSCTVLTRGTSGAGAGLGGRRPKLPAGVHTIELDRSTDEGGAALAAEVVKGGFEAVVDFFGMVPRHCADLVAAFTTPGAALQHYVFISTNMVYPGGPGGWDVSELRPTVLESAADMGSAATAADDYGGCKLRAEALLATAWTDHKFPYTTLRPPSVIGPACDDRHERLQRIAMGLPPLTPRGRKPATNRTTFRVAYSEDVGQAVVKTLASRPAALNQAFNIAMAEEVTAAQYLHAVRGAVATSGIAVASIAAMEAELAELGAEVCNYENQSVVDIAKAQEVLGFTPTPFADVIQATTEWHTPLLSLDSSGTGTV